MAELTERETELSRQDPIPVELAQLALTEKQLYRLRVGDVLNVRLLGLKEDRYAVLPIPARVHSDGTIVLPVVGPIAVADLTLTEAEEKVIAAHVAGDIAKDVSAFLELVESDVTTVLVLGAAAEPGLVRLRANERSPFYALALAGGFGAFGPGAPTANGRVVLKPIRPEREEVVYNFYDQNDVRRALLGPPLESGDVLLVEAAPANVVYVGGTVKLPGAIPLPPGSKSSVLQAVAAAGGLRPYIQAEEAELVRTLSDGKQLHVKLPLAKMMEGAEPDLALLAGDILLVPDTPMTIFQEWAMTQLLGTQFNFGVRYDPLQQYNTNRAIDADSDTGAGIRSALTTGIPQILVPPVAP
ncbi:MAG: polysaccharide biosynthesis/export family protein [Planctomycetota bacterium]